MNGLVSYDSSGSEDEEPTAPPVAKISPKVSSHKISSIKSSSSSEKLLGGSLLTSEYQLRMLSKQRSKAAKDGSKKRIFITAPNLEDLDDADEIVAKKPKIKKSTKRSMLFSALPKPTQSTNSMSSKVTIQPTSSSSGSPPAELDPPKKPATMLMPNSVKKRLEKKAEVKKPATSLPVAAKIEQNAANSDSEDSDNEGGFFNFKSKEDDAEELKRHVMNDVGPSRPSRDMLRTERDKFANEDQPQTSGVKYSTTRHPEEAEESAIAPYGHDLEGYQAIAGPIRRQSVNSDDADAAKDIDGEAIRKLQGRRREDVQFMDAKVDKSLGNIRENIRKGANQKHVSNSIVDPLKDMKKTDPNAHVSKRTHQLKYLVELAKANETRLNQLWSNAKQSSRTTAQKYGW